MNVLLPALWQANIEISLLLIVILLARFAIRKSTKVYNAYLLWLSIPAGLLVAKLVAQIEFSKPPVEAVNYIVESYIVRPAEAFDDWFYAGLVYTIITGLLLLRLLRQHHQLRRDLDSIKVNSSLNHRSRYPIVGIDKEDFSPAVYGFFRPTIYFPQQLQNKLSREQITLIIQHEEHHIKQKHLWLNLLWDILVCCMWFNPLVYISRQNFRHDQELFCDYLVLNKSTKQDHRTYGHALLSTVSATHSVSLLCSWKSFNQLEERIMNIKKPSSLSSKLALAVCCLAIVGCTSVYSASAKKGEKSEPLIAATNNHVESIHHQVDDDGSSQTTLIVNGKTYVDKNGERHMVEGDTQRAMSDKERFEFERAIENDVKGSERELIRSEFEMDRDHNAIEREIEIERIERHTQDRERRQQEQEMERHHQKMAMAKMEHSSADGTFSKQQERQAMEDLARDKQDVIRDQESMQRDAQHALEDLARDKQDVIRDRESVQRDAQHALEDLARDKQDVIRDRESIQRDAQLAKEDMEIARAELELAQGSLAVPRATQPAKPVQPVHPVQPTKPTQPAKPAKPPQPPKPVIAPVKAIAQISLE